MPSFCMAPRPEPRTAEPEFGGHLTGVPGQLPTAAAGLPAGSPTRARSSAIRPGCARVPGPRHRPGTPAGHGETEAGHLFLSLSLSVFSRSGSKSAQDGPFDRRLHRVFLGGNVDRWPGKYPRSAASSENAARLPPLSHFGRGETLALSGADQQQAARLYSRRTVKQSRLEQLPRHFACGIELESWSPPSR